MDDFQLEVFTPTRRENDYYSSPVYFIHRSDDGAICLPACPQIPA